MKKFLFISALMLMYASNIFSQAGKLDNSFGTGGKISTLVGTVECDGEAVAVQSNGKILVAGTYYSTSRSRYDFTIARYNVDGTLDNSFAGNGKAWVDFGSGNNAVPHALLIQSNGRIVVAGYAGYSFESPENIVLARLKTDGTLDASFGTNGKVKLAFPGHIESAALQQDGKIVVAGENDTSYLQYYNFATFRFNSNGTLDNSFGTNGHVFTDINGANDEAKSVAIQSNNKILVSGAAERNGIYCFGIVRYSSNGTLDASFGGDGKVTTPVGGGSQSEGYGMAIQSNGKIIQVGEFVNSKGYSEFAVLRYRTNGVLDSSFAGNGKAAVSFGGNDDAYAVSIQSNGKIIVAGTTAPNGNDENFALARLNTNGTLDKNFGNGGITVTDFGGYDDAFASAITPGGKVVLAGTSITNKRRFAVARYLTENTSFTQSNDENVTDIKAASLQIKIYPNPANDIIHIDGLNFSSALITIQNESGNTLIKETIADKNQTINISSLKPGMYILTVLQNGKTMNAKFIKQ